jgi:hypothetical protein
MSLQGVIASWTESPSFLKPLKRPVIVYVGSKSLSESKKFIGKDHATGFYSLGSVPHARGFSLS